MSDRSELLWKLGAAEAAKRFARGETTPVAILESILARIEEVNPKVNAFALLDKDGAFAAARASTERWHAGQPRSQLDGIVITVKDNITVGGLPCRWGTEVFEDFVPERDEVPVARLRDAGAVILGKTTTSEFSTGRGIVSTPKYGTTRNPWQLDRTTGSSSAGAVASVASGMCTTAIATDGGGSIRTPCSHCGLIGLKPTSGRVARAHGFPVIGGDREVIGPIARGTDDLALMFGIIAGPHPEDRSSWAFSDRGNPVSVAGLKRQKILYVPKVGDNPVAPDVASACRDVAANLAALGHDVVEGPLPFDQEVQGRKTPLFTQAGLAWLVKDKKWMGQTHPFYAEQIEKGSRLTAIDYVDALNALRDVQAEIGLFFEKFDLMLSPVTGATAWPAEQPASPHFNVFTGFVNIAGIPAISIPAALSSEGMPIGFQLAGRFGADWELLAMAREYENQHSWLDRRPNI
jgi:aspartyl-tRNA(Asn)/glutamyl-tRNA(Gln) amidotransferase subunit A